MRTYMFLFAALLLACDDGPTPGGSASNDADPTMPPPTDDCEFLANREFRSVREQLCGYQGEVFNGCHWKIMFWNEDYEYRYGAAELQEGTYSCENGEITATDDSMVDHGGTIDAASGTLFWEGVEYEPV